MLTPGQEKYLLTIPENTPATIGSFDPAAREAAEAFIKELQNDLPFAAIHYLGSSKLGLAGSNSIDICIIAGERFGEYAAILDKKFGTAESTNNGAVHHWNRMLGKYPAKVLITGKPTPRIQDDLDTQQVLEARGDLREAYEKMKFACTGMTEREYTRKKFEFFNEILHPHIHE